MFWIIYTPFQWPPFIAGVVALALAIYVRRWRPVAGARVFIWLLLAIAYWSFVNVLEVGSTQLTSKRFLADAQYPAIVSLPVLWLVFVARYSTWNRRPARHHIMAMAVVPLITLILLWTNRYHGLMRRSVRLDVDGLLPVLQTAYGPWFWVHTAYSYALLLAGSLAALQMAFSASRAYRGQALSLVVAALLPFAGNTLFLLRVYPSPYVDVTLLGITLACAGLFWGMHRYGLLDIVPASHTTIIEGMKDGLLVVDLQDRVVDLNPAMERILGITAGEVVGEPLERIFPEMAAAQCRDERCPEIVLGEGDEQHYYEPTVSALSGRGGRMAGRLIVLNDVTERRTAERAIERRNRRLAALNTIAASVSASLDLDEVMDRIRRVLDDALDIPCGALLLYDPRRERLELEMDWGLTPEIRDAWQSHPTITTYGNGRWHEGLPDVNGLPHYGACEETADSPSKWCQIIGLPLLARGELQGMLQLFIRAPATFGEDDITALGTLAQQTAAAIQNARMFGRANRDVRQLRALSRRLVEMQEAERRDISRELHEEVGQVLAALTFILERIKHLPPEAISASLSEAQMRVSELVGRVSEMSLLLRPAVLDDLGLVAALRSYFSRYTTQTGIRVDFGSDKSLIEPESEISMLLYRVAQEALSNVARHADVDRVTVGLHANDQSIMLEVHDTGVGFDAEEVLASRRAGGLIGLQERVGVLGGQLAVQSIVGDGTLLTARLPISPPKDETS